LKKNKTIGILAFAEENGGGVTEFIRSIVENIEVKSDFNFIIYTNLNEKSFNSDDRIQIVKVTHNGSSIPKKIFRALSYIIPFIPTKFLLSKQEIEVFSESDYFYCPYISSYPHYFLKRPYFFTLHDLQEYYLYKFFTLKQHIIRRVLNKALLNQAAFVTCESKFVKNDIVNFFNIEEKKIKIFQAPPSLDYLNFSFNTKVSTQIKLKYNLPNKYFFYPAQFWKHKNHIRLVKAFHKLSISYGDIYLVFTGSEKNILLKLKNEIEVLGLKEKILFLGYIENEDMPYIYKNSLSLVMPSLFESISIPVFEALTLGVPVISSNVFGLKDQISRAGVLFDPKSTKNIYESLLLAVNNKELLKKNTKIGLSKMKKIRSNFKSDLNRLFRILINEF